jgi:hypothetical protein
MKKLAILLLASVSVQAAEIETLITTSNSINMYLNTTLPVDFKTYIIYNFHAYLNHNLKEPYIWKTKKKQLSL